MNNIQIDLNELTSSVDIEFYKEKSIDDIICIFINSIKNLLFLNINNR